MPRICLFGPDGGGKTTIAKELGYEIRSFATPVKNIAHELVGREPEDRKDKEKNFRELYRVVGQRAKELHGENVWVEQMDMGTFGDDFVIDDGRFQVELDGVNEAGLITVYVNMTGAEGGCEVEPNQCDIAVDDDDSLREMMLYLVADTLVDDWKLPPDPSRDSSIRLGKLFTIFVLAMFLIGFVYSIISVIALIKNLII